MTPGSARSCPSFGIFPAASRYYSQEDCESFINLGREELRRSEVVDYPPHQFPKPEFLRDALHTVGDDRHANALADPAANEYWYFLYDLAARGDPAGRAEFLQRASRSSSQN